MWARFVFLQNRLWSSLQDRLLAGFRIKVRHFGSSFRAAAASAAAASAAAPAAADSHFRNSRNITIAFLSTLRLYCNVVFGPSEPVLLAGLVFALCACPARATSVICRQTLNVVVTQNNKVVFADVDVVVVSSCSELSDNVVDVTSSSALDVVEMK